MNPLSITPADTEQVDADLAEQAIPGHGIPSQDPDPAAQTMLAPEDAKREANSALTGGGTLAGVAAGAAIGVAVAGPVGVLAGAAIGAVAGALGGAAAGTLVNAADAASVDTAAAEHVSLHIEDTGGSGRPVVLIHGWPLTAEAWKPQVAALQDAGYRVVTYDRRGFGRSDQPASGYSYDALADDLQRVLDQNALYDVTLVGFSMGGGEVARYVARHGESRLRSVVFAAAVAPYLLQTSDNPDGPLTQEKAQQMRMALEQDRDVFFNQFTTDFYSAKGEFLATESQRSDTIALCKQSAQPAALACMDAFGTTDFREDLKKVSVPTLVIHGTADAIVPIAGSGLRTHSAVLHSQLVEIDGAPHGLNVTHTQAFNDALLAFLSQAK